MVYTSREPELASASGVEVFEPEEWWKARMQALSPTHSPASTDNARNQMRNKAVLESGSGAASILDHSLSRIDR